MSCAETKIEKGNTDLTMKRFNRVWVLALICLPFLCQAFPPAPHHTFYGMVRDEYGRPLEGENTRILFESSSGRLLQANVSLGVIPGINYRIKIPMDSLAAEDLYHPAAFFESMEFTIRVQVESRIYRPIELRGDFSTMGDPSGETRLDLTLGEDLDGDGLPDAWERSLLGAGQTLEDINGSDDTDGDGMSNLDEFISGNYAFDKNDGLRLEIVEIGEQGPVFEFLAVRGRSYELYGATQLNDWQPVSMKIAGAEESQNSWLAQESRMVQIQLELDPQQPTPQFFKLLAQ